MMLPRVATLCPDLVTVNMTKMCEHLFSTKIEEEIRDQIRSQCGHDIKFSTVLGVQMFLDVKIPENLNKDTVEVAASVVFTFNKRKSQKNDKYLWNQRCLSSVVYVRRTP